MKKSQAVAKEISAIESKTDAFIKAEKAVKYTEEIVEFLEMEEDESLVKELDKELLSAENEIE